MKYGILPTYRKTLVVQPDWVRSFAQAAEEGGCESVWAVEHMVVPGDYESRYPYSSTGRMPLNGDDPIPDPLEWLAFVASSTRTLKLGTCVIILPEHNPVQLAKRLATLDVLSGGRVIVGVGVGWMREESEAVGVPFEDRGARTDEYLDAMRVLWSEADASFEGTFVRFAGVKSRPLPMNPGGVPVVIGGHSPAAARRAGRRGDGFYPLGVTPETLASLVRVMRTAALEAGRDPAAIEITSGAPRDLDGARRLVDLGVSRFILSAPVDGDIDGVRRVIGDFAESVASRL